MKFTEQNIAGLPLFALEGKIMGDKECWRLRDRIKAVIASGQTNIILDFSRVSWLNSSGVGAILACIKELREKGGDLHFAGLNDRTAYYFRITKLDTVLKIYESTDEVLKKLTSPGVLT